MLSSHSMNPEMPDSWFTTAQAGQQVWNTVNLLLRLTGWSV